MGKVIEKLDRRANRCTTAGRKIIASLQSQLDAMRRGGGGPVREIELREPGIFTPEDIRNLRNKVDVTQRVFAHLVGVSPVLVASWEQGIRSPSRVCRRMLDEIKSNPVRWSAMAKPKTTSFSR